MGEQTKRGFQLAGETIAKSTKTYMSEIKTFQSFCETFDIEPFQISEGELIRFLTIFRNGFSAQKYLQAIRWFFTFCRQKSGGDVLFSKSVLQVLKGHKKQTELSGVRKKFSFLAPEQIRDMIQSAMTSNDFGAAAAFCLSFNFLARVKDELLPVVFGMGADWAREHPRANFFRLVPDPPSLVLFLASRKNCPKGAELTRRCLCANKKFNYLCPVHVLLRYLNWTSRPARGKVFDFSYDSFLRKMRHFAAIVGVEKHENLTSKAFRRGAAIWMLQQKNPLAQVLEAGGWRSAAFLHYVLREEVDELLLFSELAMVSDDYDEGTKKTQNPTLHIER